MKMIVREKNESAIETVIREAERRATARTVSFADLVDAIDTLNNLCDHHPASYLTKKEIVGAQIIVRGRSGSLPGSYKYYTEHTEILLERFPTGWGVMSVRRVGTGPGVRVRKLDIRFNITQREIILEKIESSLLKTQSYF